MTIKSRLDVLEKRIFGGRRGGHWQLKGGRLFWAGPKPNEPRLSMETFRESMKQYREAREATE